MKHEHQKAQPIRSIKDRKAIARYLYHKNLRDYALFEFGIRVGRRVSDLVSLNIGDVARLDRKGRIVIKERLAIREKKTQKFADILINPRARRVLGLYISKRKDTTESAEALLDEPLFKSRSVSRNGERRLSTNRVWHILKEAADECELDFNVATHSLRKTFGYELHRRGVDITLIQKLMNHASPEITLAYIGITRNEMDNAIRNL